MSDAKKICVGAIAGAFGVKGEVRLKSFCAAPADITKYNPLSSEDGAQSFKIKIVKPIKNGFAARVEGVRFRDQAEALKGIALFADREKFPNLPDDEFYHSDLIGLQALDTGGAVLGRVKAVDNYGAGDFLDITLTNGKAALVPFTKAAVPTVDLHAGKIIIDPPAGLFGEAEDE